MKSIQTTQTRDYGQVKTMHILNTGELIGSLKDYMQVESRFSWVDRNLIISRMLELRRITDENKRSIIVLYEEGHAIREFINVDETFKPLSYY